MLAEPLNSQNPTGRLHSEALRHMLWVGPKLKTEIPVMFICRNRIADNPRAHGTKTVPYPLV